MTLVELLSTLRARKISVQADGERLTYSAPPGALAPEIREELIKHKADLLAFLNQTDQARRVTRTPIVRISREAKLLPSINQRRLWFIDQLQSNAAFNSYRAFRIEGSLNILSLEQSLNEIVRRHEVLRTTFSVIDGEPLQVITSALKLKLTLLDLREIVDITERDTQADRIITEEVARPFDLATGPLLRAHLLCLSTDEHLLLITIHHIVTDGWSMGIFLRELTVLYEAFCSGNPSPLPELPIQYVDFAHWQAQWLQGEVLQQELSYWKKRLKGAPEVTELLTDYPRPAVQKFQGASEPVVISKSLTQALKTLSKKHGVTLFMTLLAAFKTLLYRYTGQEDLVLGSPIAGRGRGDVENLIGLFINTLVLRTDLSGNPSFRELLRRVRETALQAYAHQDVPFEKLIEDLHLERSLSVTSLFQVMFVLQNAPASELRLSGSTVSPVTIKRETALSDLFLSLVEKDEQLHGTLSYRTDLFNSATISRMIHRFEVLLHGIIADPDRPISTLPCLTETEKHQLLVEWNETNKDYPKDKCLHQLFEEQVDRTPEAVAVVCGDRQLTYQELNRRANQLAHYLRRCGIGPEIRVGLYMERSVEMLVGLLGVLKSSGAYVPLDPNYPMERLGFMLQDAHAPVLLTQQRLFEARSDTNPELSIPILSEVQGRDSQPKVICLDSDWAIISQESAESPVVGVNPNSLAYVIYTSGSTGTPKGVEITHRSLVNFATSACAAFELGPNDRVLQFASISFDTAAEEIYPTLVCGATLVLRSDSMLDSASSFLQRCAEWKLTVLDLPTAYWHELAEKMFTERLTLPEGLRLVIIGGERAVPERLAQWRKFVGNHVRLLNTYGPTETTIVATTWDANGATAADQPAREIPIGRPIANVRIYVLDPQSNPVPIGIPGELHIGGTGLARGYSNKPDLTAEKFIPDLFGDEPGGRLYRTGDFVRYLPDGNLEFLGRIDQQVKIRGFRVEPGEIEAILSQHPAVRETVVLAREEDENPKSEVQNQKSLEKRLVAYTVLQSGQHTDASAARSFLKEKLPEYLIPSVFVFLDFLPLTPNGKVDRKALPAPDHGRPDLQASYVSPRNPVEKTIAEIWAELLKLEQVGVHDNFFDLGGHSLLAVRVMSRVRDRFRLEIALRTLFENPTVAGLAVQIVQIKGKDGSPEEVIGLLDDLESISDEEAQTLLAREIRDEPA